MTRHLISFDDGALTLPEEEEVPAAAAAAHEAAQEAGVWIFGAGVESQRARIVATNGAVTDGPYPRPRRSSAGSRSSMCCHARRRWSGLPRSP